MNDGMFTTCLRTLQREIAADITPSPQNHGYNRKLQEFFHYKRERLYTKAYPTLSTRTRNLEEAQQALSADERHSSGLRESNFH